MTVPTGWNCKPIGSLIADIGDGGTPNTSDRRNFGGSVFWVVIQDIRKQITSTTTTLTERGLKSCSAKLWPVGTVILSTGATIGEVGVAGVPLATKQGIHGIVCSNELSSEFLYYKLCTLKDFLKANAQGSTIREVRAPFLRTIRVTYPEGNAEQSKIAEVLSTVDQLIAQTQALIAKQQRIKTGLMQDLLSRGIDEHGQLRAEATHTFKDSPLGRIPVEWEVCSLGQVTQKIADRDHTTPEYVDDGVLIISPMAFFDDESIDFARCPKITRAAHIRNCLKTDSRVGDIIIHRIGAGLGRVRVVEDHHPEYSLLHSLALIRPDSEASNTSFLKWSLRSSIVQAQMALGMQSIGVPDLGLDKIASLQFRMPTSLKEQEAIGHALNNVQKRIDELTSSKRKLELLKSGLMQDLLTGKVRVTPLLRQPEAATA